MRRHGKPAALATCLAFVSLLLVCGPAGADFEFKAPPVAMVDFNGDKNGDPVLGVRITAFRSLSESNDLIVGVPPLDDPSNSYKVTFNSDKDWRINEGCNRLEVNFTKDDIASDQWILALSIGTGADCSNLLWHTVAYAVNESSLPPEKWAAFSGYGLNVMQINIGSLAIQTEITLDNVLHAGWSADFGGFSSGYPNVVSQTSVTGFGGKSIFISPSSFMNLGGDLVLEEFPGGEFTTDSYVELLFGRYIPDNSPPDCTQGASTISVLWPPSGDFIEVGVVGVADENTGDTVNVQVTGIQQDEPLCDSAAPCQATGILGSGGDPSKARIRAQRNPAGNGRVYTVSFIADDGSGGTCSGEVKVAVPKNRGKNGVAVDDGLLYDSTNIP